MTRTTALRAAGPEGFDAAAWLEEHGAGDVLMTPDGWMTEANRPARRIFRIASGRETHGLNFRQFCREPARFTETIEAIRTAGYVGSWDADLVALDGGPIHAVVNLVGEFEAGYLVAVRGQLFDISDWRRRQERTLFGQRIEAVGRLAGGVAHDFNNLLTVISGHADCLSWDLAADSPMTRSVAAIKASAARAASLTDKLLSFGRRQVLQPRVVDPVGIVRQVEGSIRRMASPRITVEGELPATAWRVRVDSARTEGAVFAIASHALDAMAEGGSVRFQLTNVDIGPEWSPTRAFVKPGRFVRLDVSCAGLTLDADMHVRMFEPFFSVRGVIRDGMGLAAAFGLVKQSGGYMWIEGGRVDETVFSVLLPAIDGDVVSPPGAVAQRATIHVVDNDQTARRMIGAILAREGFTVLEAGHADAAAGLAVQAPAHLVITDLQSAREVERLAVASGCVSPRPRLLCISGPAANEGRTPADIPGMTHLRKPFTPAQLLARVRDLLET